MIVYQKKLLRIAEYWNGEEPEAVRVDLLRCFQQAQPLAGMICRPFHTILIDLKCELPDLFSQMKRDTRYEIRRAGNQDQLTCEWYNARDPQAFESFCDYYDDFAEGKGQPGLNRSWLSLLARAGALTVSRVCNGTDEPLVWHVYHCSSERATLLYSASLFRKFDTSAIRNRIGRANRFHHWQDMQHFKARDIEVYDLGGWYEGDSDVERLRINHFKEEFGGEIVKNYICERALTVRAKLFLRARRLLLGNAI
jgi:hypothetical protein